MLGMRILRRGLAILNSELTPTQIALGFCLGLVAGLVPWGANTLIWLLVAFLLNCSFSAALLGLALGKLLAWPLLPASYALGRAILGLEAFDPLWQRLFYSPILAWLELWRYVVFGGYVLTLALSIPAFWGVKAFVRTYREDFFAFIERSRPWQVLSKRARIFRLGQWLLFGGGVRFRAPRKRFWLLQVVRKQALVALPLLALLVYGIVAAVVPLVIDEGLIRRASLVLGGEVQLKQATANAFTGRLTLQGLTVQNPQRPDEDVLRVQSITADLGVLSLLLSRRLTFDEITIGEIFLHVKRERDGSLNLDDLVEPTSPDWREYFEWLRQNAQKVDWLTLWQRYGERYGQFVWEHLKSWLLEHLAPAIAPSAEIERLHDRKPLPPPWPVLTLKRVRVERLHLRLTDEFSASPSARVVRGKELPPLTAVDLLIENVTWDPRLSREPITLGLKAYFGQGKEETQATLTLTAIFDGRQEPPEHALTFQAQHFDLTAYQTLYERTSPVIVERGYATLLAEITLRGRELHGQTQLVITGFTLRLPEGEAISLFGLGPETSRQIVRGINAYAQKCPIVMSFAIEGTVDQPRFHWDEVFLKVAKRGLLTLGTRSFAPVLGQIDAKLAELSRLGGLQPEDLQKSLEDFLKQQLGLAPEDECALP
jgi:uncharacterized protein (TIGR03546 family)